MWVPEWLYERLPQIYVAVALACLWADGSLWTTKLSAVLLVSAALLAHLRRRSARGEVRTRN
jgi:hypothetical protein